jgi:translation initiation factor 2A
MLADDAVVGEYVLKSQTGWSLRYSPDEKFCACCITNDVQFFQAGNPSKFRQRY